MYTTSSLVNVADCETLLAMAEKDRINYDFKLTALTHSQELKSMTAAEIQNATLSAQAELNTVNALMATLPEGALKRAQEVKRMRLELKLFILSGKSATAGTVGKLDNELEINRTTLLHNETLSFITAINGRKDELTQ